MTVQEIYNLAIKMGIEADLRGKEEVEKVLRRRREKYEDLPLRKKGEFDGEFLENPYLDSRILNISEDKEIKRVLVGIDIEPAEILLAKEIGNIDLVISHHPIGKGLANLHEVMEMQCDVLNQYGVPINVAEGLIKEKISEVARKFNGRNVQRTVDAAKLLGMNLICLHTAADNLAARFLKERIESVKPERIGELLDFLKKIEEHKKAISFGIGPRLFTGNEENRCGKIAVTEITGGYESSPQIYERMANNGIGTVVAMHQSEEHRKEAEAANINVVIAGHMPSDSLGVNLFLDELEKQGVEIVPCSGLIRVSRLPRNI